MTTSQPAHSGPSPQDNSLPTHWEGHMSDGVGSTYGSAPLAFLQATAHGLELTSPRGNFRLSRASVAKIGRSCFYPWFFRGIRIHHQDTKCPEELQFKALGTPSREIVERLRELGYPTA